MSYVYLKSNILSLSSFNENDDDFVLLESNKSKLEEIYSFLASPINTLVLSGFQGVGKTKLVDYSLNALNDEVLLFKYTMHEATTLDDLLLQISNTFKNYQKSNQLSLPKVDTKDFREKINTYIKSTDKPMLLILDSYENVLGTTITDFILHLSALEQFKIIFVSRTFDSNIFTDKNIHYEKIIFTSIDEELVPKFLNHNKIQYTSASLDKLITNTKCYYQNLKTAAKLIQTINISLTDLFAEFDTKNMPFSNYLIFKLLTLAPDNTKEFLYFISLIRHGLTEQFISENELLSTQQIAFLTNIYLMSFENNEFYLKNYIKPEIIKEIPQLTKSKIHEFLKHTYEQQLPLKPAERVLPLSRSTMHIELKYHSDYINQAQTGHVSKGQNLSYLSYVRSGGINWDQKISKNKEPKNTLTEEPKIESKLAQSRLDIDLADLELSPEELAIVGEEPAGEIPNATSGDQPAQCTTCEVNIKNTLEDYMKLADKFEQNFNFCDAIYCYRQALETSPDDLDGDKHANILSRVAVCYAKTNQDNNSVNCYNMAYELYMKENETVKANYILLKLAQEYKDNFKFYFAKQNLNKIINSSAHNPPNLLGQAYLLLADIEDSTSNITDAKELYGIALDFALKTDDLKLISSAYFKYALLLDDTNKTDLALEYYKKSIETSSDCEINTYVSSAYSNIALICYEKGEVDEAIKYYDLSLECDLMTKNFEGLYFVYAKMAEIFVKTDKKSAYEYLIKALNSAKRSKDKFYVATAFLEIGDYHYLLRQDEKALKAYLMAQEQISQSTTNDNIQKIKDRLNDLRIRLGTPKYQELIKKGAGVAI